MSEALARAQAAREFTEGSRAFDHGDFARAADAFELAYRILPHVDSLWNAARAREAAGDLGRGATLFARYLREAPIEARDRNVAAAELMRLATRLGRIEVHGNSIEQLSVDEHPSDERIVYVRPGAHVVRAVVAGKLMQQIPELGAGDVVSLVFDVPAIAPPPEPLPADHPEPSLRAPPNARRGISPWVVIAGGALTGVALAATLASGVSTLSALDTFNARPTAANLDSGQAMQSRTNVLLGVSIGLGVTTAATAIWLTDWSGASGNGVRLGVEASRIEAAWRF
jgi:hypothetical protein